MAPADRLLEATAKIVVTGDAKVGSVIELSNADNTDVRVWHWNILPPDGSEAFLANRTSAKSSFKIDRPGAYAVRLRVNDGPHESVDRTAVLVAEPGPVAGAYELTVDGAHLVVSLNASMSVTRVRIPSGSTTEAIRELNTVPVSEWLRKWSSSPPVAPPDPFAGALRLLEGSNYTGFVVAAQTEAGGTMVCAKDTTAKLRARVDEQMAQHDSGVARDDDEDRPHTAVAQLRELANWLRAEGEGTKADDADELAEAIAFKYEVE